MKISMIVFDMAGTTIDEDNIVYKTLHTSIQAEGVDVTLEDVLTYGAGKEKFNAIQDIVNFFGTKEQEALSSKIFDSFLINLKLAYNNADIKGMQNAEEVLVNLRSQNILVVLNTGYDRSTAISLLDKINWKQSYHYDLLITASDVTNSRPSPDMITHAMNLFSIDNPKLVIKVGDSKIDIEEGRNAKCLYSIGVTTGAHTANQLAEAKPDFIINSLIELFPIISNIKN